MQRQRAPVFPEVRLFNVNAAAAVSNPAATPHTTCTATEDPALPTRAATQNPTTIPIPMHMELAEKSFPLFSGATV
jgi:hypothetical protein